MKIRQTRTRLTPARALASGLIVAALGLNLTPLGLWGMSPAHAETDTLRAEVGKPLQAAQELIKNKKYKEALAKVRELDGVANKTAYENFTIERMRGAAASGAGDTDLAAKSFETVINTGRLPPSEQLKLIEAVAGTYYRSKDYGKAAMWSKRYLKEDGSNAVMHTLLTQSLYLGGDYAGAANELAAEFQADDKAGRVPTEERLRLAGGCYAQLKDNVGYVSVLERLLGHYPKKDYWADILARVQRKPGFADRLSLDLLRLQLATGNLTSAANFMEMTQLALQAGFPAEAKKVIDKGFESGILGIGADADRHKRLRDVANRQVAEDLKSLSDGDKQAEEAKSGTALLNTGYNYVMNGKFDKGIAMMEQGVGRGGLKRPEDAKLHLGIAYLQAGNKAKATQVLKTVQGGDGTADLARLWAYVH